MKYKPEYTQGENAMRVDFMKYMDGCTKNYNNLVAIDKAAKEKGEIKFRYFTVPRGDGYAFYQVVMITGKKVLVNLCDDVTPDNWYCTILGVGGQLSLDKVTKLIHGRDALDKLFSRK